MSYKKQRLLLLNIYSSGCGEEEFLVGLGSWILNSRSRPHFWLRQISFPNSPIGINYIYKLLMQIIVYLRRD